MAGDPKRKKSNKAIRSDVGCKLYGPTESKPRFRVIGSSGRKVTGWALPLDRRDDPIWDQERRWADGQVDRAVAWARAQAQDGPARGPRHAAEHESSAALGWRHSSVACCVDECLRVGLVPAGEP
jgi:hypothetical protein